jgi:rhodanese-related sulfurtransferase/glutaredoxin
MDLLMQRFLVFLFVGLLACNNTASTQSLDVNNFSAALKNAETQLLDVRTIEEYNNGHLPNALQANWNNENEFIARTKVLDKNKTVLVYCLSGVRSNSAMEWLYSKGFTKVYNLQGGINKWKQANMPIDKGIEVLQINVDSFNADLKKYDNIFVDFGAPWCPPCKKMEPTIDSLQQKFKVIKVNVSEQEKLAKAFGIDEMPTIIYFKKGVEVFRTQGVLSLEALLLKTKL